MTNKGFPVCFLSVLKSFSAPETKRLQLFSDNEAIIDSGCHNFFFLKFRHQVPFIRVKKPSLGWKRGGKKGGVGG